MTKASIDFYAEDILKGEVWERSWEQDLSNPDALRLPPEDTRPLEERCFDLASLSKAIVTSSLLVEFAESDDKGTLAEWSEQKLVVEMPEFKGTLLENLTLRACWEHRSGLPAFLEFSKERARFVKLADRKKVHSKIIEQALVSSRSETFNPSQGTVYSDLGFSLLGVYLERRTRKTMDMLWDAWKLKHLADSPDASYNLRYSRDNELRKEALATETRHSRGHVNDDNTYGMGGVAAHAGLFGSVLDVAEWIGSVWAWARVSSHARDWIETPCPESQRFVFGWDTPSGDPKSQAGGAAAPKTVRGHLGYTGTALWMDPQLLRLGVLLTNRVYPQHTPESQKSIQRLRWWCFESLWQGTLELGWQTQNKTGAGPIS